MPVGQSEFRYEVARVRRLGVYPGQAAPDFTAAALDGQEFKLSACRGKLVFIDFCASWCGPCVAELPTLKKAHERFAADGLVIVTISFDKDAETARALAERQGLRWPQVWAERAEKGPLAELYGVGGIPATFLVGPDGTLVARDLRGNKLLRTIEQEIRELKRAADEQLAGSPPGVP